MIGHRAIVENGAGIAAGATCPRPPMWTVLAETSSPSSAVSQGPTFPQRALTYLIEEVSLRTYLLVFAGVVLGCGWAILVPDCARERCQRFSAWVLGRSFFFSIVTVTSLGYGDMYPVGISRAIAGAEVLFGLAFMGIMIAKVTSRRLSYHVRRLFVSDAQQRLDDFADKFATMRVPLIDVHEGACRHLSANSGTASRPGADKTGRAAPFQNVDRAAPRLVRSFAQVLLLRGSTRRLLSDCSRGFRASGRGGCGRGPCTN